MTKFLIGFLILIAGVIGGYLATPAPEHNNTTHATAMKNTADRHKSKSGIEYDYSNLELEIDGILGAEAKNYSIFVLYPDSKSPALSIRPGKRRSASMIKVFIMEYTMAMVKDGKASLDDTVVLTRQARVGGAGVIGGYGINAKFTIKQLLEYMIQESDNTATNMLIFNFGMDNINRYLDEKGYKDTELQRKMMDSTKRFDESVNYTSPDDLGLFFNRLYTGTCVSPELDDMMIDILLGQKDTVCLPAAMPYAKVAHKTGELNDLYDDGGIVFTGDVDFILVVMDENVGVGYAREYQKDIARAVYRNRKQVEKLIKYGKNNFWSK